jgi:hypothetical protein
VPPVTPATPVVQGPVAPPFVGPTPPPFVGPTAPIAVSNPPIGPLTPLRPPTATTGAATVTTVPGTVEPHGARTTETTTTSTTTSTTTTTVGGAAVHASGQPARKERRHAGAPAAAPRNDLFKPHDIGFVPGSDVLPIVHSIVTRSVSHPELPLGLVIVVVLFLLVQHRIDRRDPKLAHAPSNEPETLEFGSAISFA